MAWSPPAGVRTSLASTSGLTFRVEVPGMAGPSVAVTVWETAFVEVQVWVSAVLVQEPVTPPSSIDRLISPVASHWLLKASYAIAV